MKYPRLTALSAIAAAALVIGAAGASATCPDSNDVRAQLSPALAIGGETSMSTVGFGGSAGSKGAGNVSRVTSARSIGGYNIGASSVPGGGRLSDGVPMAW